MPHAKRMVGSWTIKFGYLIKQKLSETTKNLFNIKLEN
jgi:hypothetical protein